MALVEQWDAIEAGLGDWADARIRLALHDPDTARRAAGLLAPLNPARAGDEVRLYVVRRGAGTSAGAVRRALQRLDRERIEGDLELLGQTQAAAPPPAVEPPSLAAGWEALLATLPPDWSDLYVELQLLSTDFVARASLRMAPLNARRAEETARILRFRVARVDGYGASPEMVRRCLERCDEDSIRGELRLLRVLSGTLHVATQGPVWQIAGRTV